MTRALVLKAYAAGSMTLNQALAALELADSEPTPTRTVRITPSPLLMTYKVSRSDSDQLRRWTR